MSADSSRIEGRLTAALLLLSFGCQLAVIALCVVASLSISTAVSFAHPAGKTTVQETVTPAAGGGEAG